MARGSWGSMSSMKPTTTLHTVEPAIVCPANASPVLRLAARELQRYIYLRTDQLLPITERLPERGDTILLEVAPSLEPQQYTLKTAAGSDGKSLRISGGSDVAVLYGAYHWVEKLGVRFGLHGDVIPDGKIAFALTPLDEDHKPLFELRGVNPWGSHSEGMDLWNTDDYIQVFGQLAKLRMNFLGIHSYPEHPEPRSQYDSEATVWIGPPGDFDEQGRVSRSFSASYFNTLRDGQWGYIPRATGDYRFGASRLFERDDWGPDVMLGQCPVPTTPEGCNDVFNRAGQMFDEAFSVARMLGVKTCIGTEAPLTIPEAVKARFLAQHKDPSAPAVVRELYTGIFKRIAAAHPLDYYWVWTPEDWMWSGNSQEQTQAFIEDFEQAVEALKDAGAPFELATCGWVLGPKQDRAGWTCTLPRQVSVSALSEAYRGPVDPTFAGISGRGKWAIPWLEEDNALLGPQLWVARIRKDAADALAYGCTGLMGLHWRTREVGPQIAALARAGWSQEHWNPQAGSNPPGVPQSIWYEGPKPPYGSGNSDAGMDCGSTDQPIAGTEDDPLYQSYRQCLCGYRLRVPGGRYRVTLGFIEPQYEQAGQRVFDVKLQDRLVADKLDIYERAGHMTALDIHADSVDVMDGWLHLDLQPVKGQTCIAMIVIEGAHFKRKVNCGGMAYRDYQADPPRTKTFNWGPKDTAHEQRGLACDDFYLDWASHHFGQAVGPSVADVFTRLDGRVPLVSSFDGGAGALYPDSRTWELVEKEFDFLDELEGLQPRVEGAGNRDRYEYWLNMFRHLKAQARVRCIWGQLDAAVAKAKAEEDPATRKAIIEGPVFELRNGMTQAIADAYQPLFGIVSSPGGMATVINWEGHVYRRMIQRPEQVLAELYGQPLPPPPALTQRYQGPPRLIVPTVRTMVSEREALTLKVIVLDNDRPAAAALHWRPMGQGAYRQIALSHVTRGVHRVTLPPAGGQSFEYYITATTAGGQRLTWPATAPQINQTVVVLSRERE